jgi:hypothetical protein
VPIAAIALPRPARPCFPDLESRNPNRLHLISFRLARTRARVSLRGRSPFERIPRSRRCTGPDEPMRGSAERRKRAFEGPD